jgi:ATP-dependent Clp protease ATP-binding subunit ClpA
MIGIIDIQLRGVENLLRVKNIKIEFSKDAKEFLLNRGYDLSYGARPLKRTIQKCVLNPLSTELLLNNIESGDTIIVESKGAEKLEFKKV